MRFSKGTTDHDGDGKMGGSKKASAKPAAKKAPAVKVEAPKGPTPEQIEAADLEASVGRHPGGMEPPLSVEEEKARVAADFANADRKADPRFDEAQAIRAVRGF